MTLAFCLNFASLISVYSAKYNVDDQIVHKVMFAESGCRANVRNSRVGCVGLMQICRGAKTTGKHFFTDAQLRKPKVNIRIGVRRILLAQLRCGPDPMVYLGNYAGLKCGPSDYARKVLKFDYETERAGPPQDFSVRRSGVVKGDL